MELSFEVFLFYFLKGALLYESSITIFQKIIIFFPIKKC